MTAPRHTPSPTLPHGRVLTDQPWADVVVDLRTNRSAPLPVRPFNGRRKIEVDGTTITGSRRGDNSSVCITQWTEPTGFTAAVVTLNAPTGEFATTQDVLPNVAFLTTDTPGSKYKNAAEPRERGAAAFAAATPVLRRVLTDGTITTPVPGVADARTSLMYRLAWAAVGVEDLTEVSLFLRDWDEVSPFPGDGRTRLDWFPEVVTMRGPNLVAAWQQAGFADYPTINRWLNTLYMSMEDARIAAARSRTHITDLATWHRAGFTPEETIEWFPAARYNPNEYTRRFVPAEVCAQVRREQRVTAEHMSYLTLGLPDQEAASAAARHVRTWLNVSSDPTRVCWYIAAGIGKAEAKAMEKSDLPPTIDQLRLMAALTVPGGVASLPDID